MPLQGFGLAVDLALALGVLEHAALAGQHELPPPVAYGFADQHLVGAETVERGRIEMGVAKVQGTEKQPRRIPRVRRGA